MALTKAPAAQFPNAADAFGKMIGDTDLLVRPRLYNMDGIMAMEETAPSPAIRRRVRHSGVCRSVALDSVFCPSRQQIRSW